jgi:hypothetical protein
VAFAEKLAKNPLLGLLSIEAGLLRELDFIKQHAC